MIDSCVGKTAINHNRCLHLTAAEFLERVRAAHAQEEDFDAVVDEFGMGCPCKHPPLKSKGKLHLGTTTHKTAFGAGGQFCGMTVRQALERARSNNIILVAGAAPIGGNGDDVGVVPVAAANFFDVYNWMGDSEPPVRSDNSDEDEQAAAIEGALDDGEDVTNIVPDDD